MTASRAKPPPSCGVSVMLSPEVEAALNDVCQCNSCDRPLCPVTTLRTALTTAEAALELALQQRDSADVERFNLKVVVIERTAERDGERKLSDDRLAALKAAEARIEAALLSYSASGEYNEVAEEMVAILRGERGAE
jgi:hypothetical protein